MRKMMTKKFAMEEAGEPEHKRSLGMFKKKIKTKGTGSKFSKASMGAGSGAMKTSSFKSSSGK